LITSGHGEHNRYVGFSVVGEVGLKVGVNSTAHSLMADGLRKSLTFSGREICKQESVFQKQSVFQNIYVLKSRK
jgi:hypothetical protein